MIEEMTRSELPHASVVGDVNYGTVMHAPALGLNPALVAVGSFTTGLGRARSELLHDILCQRGICPSQLMANKSNAHVDKCKQYDQ